MNYKVGFVDYPTHYRRLEKEIDAAIKEVLTGGDLIMRRQLREFETNIASLVGVDYAVGLNSGTDALHLSLVAAGIGPGDEVITVAHTFVATVAVIVHRRATPILVDVSEDFNMVMEQVEKAISPRTRAIIPVHLNGRLCNMEKLMKIATKHNLIVVEDAAQALGATFDGKKAGSFGLTGCFSFYPAKILGGFGDGGMVVTNNKEIAEKIRFLSDHGQKRETGDILFYGFNSRLDNMQAAILDVKLKHLPKWIERRRELAIVYEKGLSDLPQIKTPPPPEESRYFDIFTNYVVRAQKRDKLVSHLNECGIEVMISWPKPMHHHKGLGLGHFRLPETERISREVISLPLYPELSDDKVEYVIKSIHDFYRDRKVLGGSVNKCVN
jgi:dTDP-4-amino-4,6-dideoxygalactose transaminase